MPDGLPVEPAHFVFERFDAQRILYRNLQPLGADGLDDEIARARAHRRDHRFDRAVRRLHDGRNGALLRRAYARARLIPSISGITRSRIKRSISGGRRFEPLQRRRAAVERFGLIAKAANQRSRTRRCTGSSSTISTSEDMALSFTGGGMPPLGPARGLWLPRRFASSTYGLAGLRHSERGGNPSRSMLAHQGKCGVNGRPIAAQIGNAARADGRSPPSSSERSSLRHLAGGAAPGSHILPTPSRASAVCQMRAIPMLLALAPPARSIMNRLSIPRLAERALPVPWRSAPCPNGRWPISMRGWTRRTCRRSRPGGTRPAGLRGRLSRASSPRSPRKTSPDPQSHLLTDAVRRYEAFDELTRQASCSYAEPRLFR